MADLTEAQWVTVRVEDTCDGLLINEDDAKIHGLELDKQYAGYMLSDGRFRISLPRHAALAKEERS